MEYPKEVLPQNNYRIIDCDLSEFYLIRIIPLKENAETIVNDPASLISSESGTLDYVHICSPSENIVDYSTSLGGVFTPEHIFLSIVKGSGLLKDWEVGSSVDEPVFETDFTWNKEKVYFLIKVNDVNDFEFDIISGQGNKQISLKCKCVVAHTPLRWNFWHFSLHWMIDGKLFKSKAELGKGMAQKIGHKARVRISEKLIFPPNAVQLRILEESFFCNPN